MSWIRSMIRLIPTSRPPVDQQAFKRRERELRERLARLERLAVEADVISRTDHPEKQPWNER